MIAIPDVVHGRHLQLRYRSGACDECYPPAPEPTDVDATDPTAGLPMSSPIPDPSPPRATAAGLLIGASDTGNGSSSSPSEVEPGELLQAPDPAGT